ncbi:MAG: CBS domain-containing protein [Polyangiaceae bacterium]|nr:CBS domain-containing protein [Polyangiaceae bacterium]
MGEPALRTSYPPPSRSVPVKHVSELLQSKGTEIWAIDPESSVFEAIQIMADQHCGALLVMLGSDLQGIVSERDYARKVILEGRASKDTMVAEIMSVDIISASPEMETRECLELMTKNRIRHLPVMENETVVGVLSLGDVAGSIMEQQNTMLEEFQRYVSG